MSYRGMMGFGAMAIERRFAPTPMRSVSQHRFIWQPMAGFGAALPFLSMATINADGIREISPSDKTTVKAAIDMGTADDQTGASSVPVPGYQATSELVVVPAVGGDQWLSDAAKTNAVLYAPGAQLSTTYPAATFYVTKDPQFIADRAAYDGGDLTYVDGPASLLSSAQGLTKSGSAKSCPAGQVGIPPLCFPLSGGGASTTIPTLPQANCPSGQVSVGGQCLGTAPCGPNQQEIYGVCYPMLGTTGGATTAGGGGAPAPPGGSTTGGGTTSQASVTGGPSWVLPALLGVGAVAVVALMATHKKAVRQ